MSGSNAYFRSQPPHGDREEFEQALTGPIVHTTGPLIGGSAMGTLEQYKDEPLVISALDAQRVLLFFFHQVPPQIDDNDRRFAQAIILAAAEASAQIGLLERLWRTASSPTAKPFGILKSTAKSLLRYLNRPKSVVDAVDSPKYDMVVNSIAYGFSSVWKIRIQTEDSSLLM